MAVRLTWPKPVALCRSRFTVTVPVLGRMPYHDCEILLDRALKQTRSRRETALVEVF